MPNLIITNQCQNNCSYCFTGEAKGITHLTVHTLEQWLPFIRSFKQETIHLVGGEPTENPQFSSIVNLLLSNGFTLMIFSHGKIPESIVDGLSVMTDGPFRICVNRTDLPLPTETKILYRKLGHCVSLGVTVFHHDQSIEHLFDEIQSFHLQSYFRLGIALPSWPEAKNDYVDPQSYSSIAHSIFQSIQRGVTLGIRPEFDCGFPFCFFTKAQKDFLAQNDIKFTSNCGIIPDIGYQGNVIPCFPLSYFGEHIGPETKWSGLEKKLFFSISGTSKKYLFATCADCEFLDRKECCGGCMALRIQERFGTNHRISRHLLQNEV